MKLFFFISRQPKNKRKNKCRSVTQISLQNKRVKIRLRDNINFLCTFWAGLDLLGGVDRQQQAVSPTGFVRASFTRNTVYFCLCRTRPARVKLTTKSSRAGRLAALHCVSVHDAARRGRCSINLHQCVYTSVKLLLSCLLLESAQIGKRYDFY